MKNVNATTSMTAKLFLLLSFVGGTLISAKAQMNAPVQRTISAMGNAKVEVVPDQIYVQVNLREYDKKGDGKIGIESIKNHFLAACKSLGLNDTDVTVQSYQGWDGNSWWLKKNKKQNPDMKAGINYWVKVSSVKKMDELVTKLDDEATENFFIAKTDYSKADEIKKQLKIDAIKAAKEKATYLAAAINEKVGNAITINEPNELGNHPIPMYATAMYKRADAAEDAGEPAMNVDFKKMKIEYEANVVFALL